MARHHCWYPRNGISSQVRWRVIGRRCSTSPTTKRRRRGKAPLGREEAVNLAGGHTAATKVAWQGRRVMWDRVEALDLAGGGGG
uniref:Uncharacterized protein n=1 Tax=Oryza punctata TaxID=4537 RepID=A0A0E0JJW0_ORYPU